MHATKESPFIDKRLSMLCLIVRAARKEVRKLRSKFRSSDQMNVGRVVSTSPMGLVTGIVGSW